MRHLLPICIVGFFPMIHAILMMQLDEAVLRKTIIDLQTYRRWGLRTPADIEKYNADLNKRVGNYIKMSLPSFSFICKAQAKVNAPRDHDRGHGRASGRHSTGPDPRREDGIKPHEREATPRLSGSTSGAVVPVRRPRKLFNPT